MRLKTEIKKVDASLRQVKLYLEQLVKNKESYDSQYFESQFKEYTSFIASAETKLKELNQKFQKHRILMMQSVIVVFALLVFSGLLLIFKPTILGYVTYEEINATFTENAEYPLVYSGSGYSLKLSGSADGTAVVYLDYLNESYLLLNKTNESFTDACGDACGVRIDGAARLRLLLDSSVLRIDRLILETKEPINVTEIYEKATEKSGDETAKENATGHTDIKEEIGVLPQNETIPTISSENYIIENFSINNASINEQTKINESIPSSEDISANESSENNESQVLNQINQTSQSYENATLTPTSITDNISNNLSNIISDNLSLNTTNISINTTTIVLLDNTSTKNITELVNESAPTAANIRVRNITEGAQNYTQTQSENITINGTTANVTEDMPPDGEVPVLELEPNMAVIVRLDDYFKDPEGEKLKYRATDSEGYLARVSNGLLNIETFQNTGTFSSLLEISDKKHTIIKEIKVKIGNASNETPVSIPAIIPVVDVQQKLAKRGVVIDSIEKFNGRSVMRLNKGKNKLEIIVANETLVSDVVFDEATVEAELLGKVAVLTTPVVAVNSIPYAQGRVTLEKKGEVRTILRCKDYDFGAGKCTSWSPTNIRFDDNGTHIRFDVTGFSGYGGTNITIIDTKSFPTIGGYWTTRFTTYGTANLTITTVTPTQFGTDIEFTELKCGESVVAASYDGTRVFYPDYYCNQTSYHKVYVKTAGTHVQKFEFGDAVGYSENFASNMPRTLNIQGKLTNSTGGLVNQSNVAFSFRIFNVSSGGTKLWEENLSLNVSDGIYDAILGLNITLNISFDRPMYLEIEVEGDGPMQPRINLTSQPYAFRAMIAEEALSLSCTDCINMPMLNQSSINYVYRTGDTMTGTLNITAPGTGLNVTNNAFIGGNLTVVGAISGTGADLAEYILVNAIFEPGDVLVITDDLMLGLSTKPYDKLVAGVVSTEPGAILGSGKGSAPLGLAGRVPVKVTTENGLIRRGDWLTTSSVPGKAMRCLSYEDCKGAAIGKSLENQRPGQEKVYVLLSLS